MNSIWRDVKTYGHYAYVTTEAYNGLLIMNLSIFLIVQIPTLIFIQVHQIILG